MSKKIGLALALVLVFILSLSGFALGSPAAVLDAKPLKPHKLHLIEDAAKVLDIKAEELKEELKQGKSLKEIADQKGIKEQELIQKLEKQISKRLKEGVKEGRLTEEKAEKIKAKLKESLPKVIDKKWDAEKIEQAEIYQVLFQGVHEQIKETLKIDAKELRVHFKNGKSLADIAEEQNIEVSELIAKIQETVDKNLEQLVKDQKISEQKAIKIKEKLPDQIRAMIHREHDKHERKEGC